MKTKNIKFKKGKITEPMISYDTVSQNLIINIPELLKLVKYNYVEFKGKIK